MTKHEHLLEIIKAMEQEKRDKKQEPVLVTGMEISEEVKKMLRALTDNGDVHASVTVNDFYVKTVTKPTAESQQ